MKSFKFVTMKLIFTILLTCIFLFNTISINAQFLCGTKQDKNSNIEKNYLEFKNNNSGKLKKYSLELFSDINIPICFHVIRTSTGESDFDSLIIDTMINTLNEHFNPTPFSFYQCGAIDYIDNDDYLLIIKESNNISSFFKLYNSTKAINIYLPKGVSSQHESILAFAYLPWFNNHTIVISQSLYNNEILIHEMGHLLGLYHTHQGHDELVDGSNCHIKGDLCCDTPAEPILSDFVDNNCNYFGEELDDEGQAFMPAVGNYMSYAPIHCLTFFTEDQINRMLFFYQTYISKFQCDDSFEYTDLSITNITTYPYPAMEGEPYSIIAEVRNKGNTKAKSVLFTAYLNSEKLGRNRRVVLYEHNLVAFDFNTHFPTAAGRYNICIESDGDSLEINPLNNNYCSDILVRQEEGIADISISNLRTVAPSGEQSSVNEIEFQLENLGSVEAQDISGNVYVNDLLKGEFTFGNINVGEKVWQIVKVPLGIQKFYKTCIEINPAFAEERLGNNKECITIRNVPSLWSDIVVDSFSLEPMDTILEPGNTYTLKYHFKNNGPGVAFNNKVFLKLNNETIDSLIYQKNLGFSSLYSGIDSIDFNIPFDHAKLEVCIKFQTYRDEDQLNNELCKTYLINTSNKNKNIPDRNSPAFNIYSNPFSKVIRIKSINKINNVKVYDVLGSIVADFAELNDKEVMLPLYDVPPGIYTLVIVSNKKKYFRRIMKLE